MRAGAQEPQPQPHPSGGPLAGVRVVDLTVNVLGPMATQILGDLGADVVKVEPPEGDPMRTLGPQGAPGLSPHFVGLNRNKRSVVLDLKRPAAHAALLRLVRAADVFVHNMRPAAAARLRIDYPTLAAAHPRLVYAWASGYRKDGPRADRPALDDVIQGESGLAALHARAGGEPRFVPMAFADKYCGVVLASAVGMALFQRERSGRGQEVHVPMFETLVAFNLADHLWHGAFGAPERGLGYPRMFTPHRRPLPTADGFVCLLVHTDAQWRRMFAALERPALADDPRFATLAARTEHIDALYALVAEAMRRRPTAEWRQRLDAADVPNGPLLDLDDLWHDPYLREAGFFQRQPLPSGVTLETPGIPLHFSATPGTLRRPPPLLGEHSAEVLAEAGLDATEIAALAAPPAEAKD